MTNDKSSARSGGLPVLWTREQVARILTKRLQRGRTILTVEPGPCVGAWRRALRAHGDSVVELTPAWFEAVMRAHGYQRLEAEPPTMPATFAAASNFDQWPVSSPLARIRDPEPVVQKHRTLDAAAADLNACVALTITGGEHLRALLAGASRLLESHRPVVVIDTALGQLGPGVLDGLLPAGCRLLSPTVDGAAQDGRFVVFGDGTLEAEIPPLRSKPDFSAGHGQDDRPTLSFSYGYGVADARAGLRWDESCHGLGVAVELPGGAARLTLRVRGWPKDGCRLFVDGAPVPVSVGGGAVARVEASLRLGRTKRIGRIMICPIRHTTVQRFEPLVLEDVGVTTLS